MKKIISILMIVTMVAVCVSALAAPSKDVEALTEVTDTKATKAAAADLSSKDIVADCAKAAAETMEVDGVSYKLVEAIQIDPVTSKDFTVTTITPFAKDDKALATAGAYMGALDAAFDNSQMVKTGADIEINDDGSLTVHLSDAAMENAAKANVNILYLYKA